jgi:hypothetical protein
MAKKTMNRSRNQLASAYAPESFFVFEGGLGACLAKAVATSKAELDTDTRIQIAARLDELVRAWFDTAMGCRGNEGPSIVPKQCLERPFLDEDTGQVAAFDEEKFVYLEPQEMGYVPAPLTFVCRHCRRVRTYDSLAHMKRDLARLEAKGTCRPEADGTPGNCDWRQLDVLFVHWSGRWERAMPAQYQWDKNERKVVLRRQRCTCGEEEVVLDRSAAGIGDWMFRCARCATPLGWRQNDPDTLEMLSHRAEDAKIYTEARMEAVSCRASQVYYVQADQFINFRDDKHHRLRLLLPDRREDLETFIAERFGFSYSAPTDEELEKAVRDAKLDKEWAEYESVLKGITGVEELLATQPQNRHIFEPLLAPLQQSKAKTIKDWENRRIIRPRVGLPEGLRATMAMRTQRFASRYDPFRLAVEHAALKETKLVTDTGKFGRRAFVAFDRLDDDLAPGPEVRGAQERDTRQYLDQLGIETMGLIREFDLCRFAFGYSRVSPGPVLPEKRALNMPVRLRPFPAVKVQGEDRYQRPVYVITQGNEAIYVKLNEERVYEWLGCLDCEDYFPRGDSAGWRVGAGLLEQLDDLGLDRYLQHLKKRPRVYYYTYTLLHTYAHLLMRQIAEFSGLDLGSLGEYLFPADLGFVVYRNSTTLDLGNLSALWRNSNLSFLRSCLSPTALGCGSGSLCLNRGGACPDCIMVPETSCIASNSLLSRSVLRGRGRPPFDSRSGAVRGYLDLVNERYLAVAA